MDRGLMEAVRQQSDDLREELKALEQWEEQANKAAEARKARKTTVSGSSVAELPIRGTVPSIKQAMLESAKKNGKALPPEQDPVHLAKEKGNEYFRIGKISEAIEAYSQGINLDPHSASTAVLYGNRAMCYLKKQEFSEAEKDATTCVQMNKGYVKGYFRRAVARKNLGKFKEARADLESVLALAPNDSSALAELNEVTKKLQAERSQASAPSAKKRIIIEEVEDEDEDGEQETGVPAAMKEETTAAPVTAKDEARQARLERQAADLECARRADDDAKKRQVLEEERTLEARRRHNPRVEIIEEDEEENVQVTEPNKEAVKNTHTDCSAADLNTKKETTAASRPAADLELAAGTSGTEAAGRQQKEKALSPTVRQRQRPAKESLKAPQSFSEFERVFVSVEDDDELRNYYVSLMNPATLPNLFGSNLTPETLSRLLQSVKTMSGTVAFQFLKGLSKVKRVEEMAIFFSQPEQQQVDAVLAVVKASGVSAKELDSLVRVFKPF